MPSRNVDLTDHFDTFVERSVASGRYENASEVVRDGLRLLEHRQERDALELERLREFAQVGLEALEAGDYFDLAGEAELREFVAEAGREASARARAGGPG